MSVDDLLVAEATTGRIQAIVETALLEHRQPHSCPAYFDALRTALIDEPPPFGTGAYAELYGEASADPRWMAVSLMTNAEREGDGAKRLWSLSACSPNPEERQLLKTHAVDESRHALIYLALLDLTFPGITEPTFRKALQQLSPRYSMNMETFAVEGSPYAKPPTIDDFLQMNIAEIRTTVHHLMQRSALASHAPPENRKRIVMILDSLLRDELNHVAYTAVLIERLARALPTERVAGLFKKRFRDFNQITSEELEEHAFDCSVACCAKRPHCRAKALPLAFADAPM